ncbi:MAG: response regulator [Holosporales bacterium]|nr:response regulator [Holosporales bacterium]
MYYKLWKEKKQTDYYLDVVRSVSKAICKNHEIVAFDEYDMVAYTTHPSTYQNKRDFLRVLRGRINTSPELQNFQNAVENGSNKSELLSGSGNGLPNSTRKWMAIGSAVDGMFVVILSEITKYLEEIEKIERNYERLEMFLDKFPFGIFYVNNLGMITGANSTFASLLVINRDRMIGLPISEFIENFNYNMIEQKPTSVVIKPRFSTNFKALLVKFTSSSNVSYVGQPWILFKVGQYSLENCSTNDNEFLDQESFVSAPVPSVITTTYGEVIALNPAFATLIQDKMVLDKYKIVKPGANIIDYIRKGEDLSDYLKKIYSIKGNPHPIEIKFIGIDITAMAYINKLEVPKSLKRKDKLVLIQLVDISSQKRLEQQFIQSQKMQAVGQLAGGIAHDFNNLLTAMIGFCDLLLQRYTPNDPSYGDVIQIRQNASRAANLVRQLLAFSRQQTMKPKVLSITEVLAELTSLLRRLIGIGIDFQIIHGRDIWPVKVDNSQLEQVIINLAVNARDAMENTENSKLIIKTQNFVAKDSFKCVYDTAHAGEYVLIEVIDNGSGIDPEIIEKIFEPFFTKKGTKSGTGLGLSTVYGIVNQTGGFVNVNSIVGKGSTLQVYLPRYYGKESVQLTQPEQIAKDLSGSETILLVEDEDAVRMFSARALRDKGYKVLEASSGEEALKIVRDGEKFDLLITDVMMPRMDGPTLNKKMREIIKNLKTIFISGYAEDTFRKDLDKDSGIHFLQKPFTLKDLASKVKEVIME